MYSQYSKYYSCAWDMEVNKADGVSGSLELIFSQKILGMQVL